MKVDLHFIKSRLFGLFHKIKWAALVSALLAATMGGVVRVTGSGLGCPDWPLCYGHIIPPMDVTAWIEYIHRLSGALAGIFILIMAASALTVYNFNDRVLKLVLLTPGIVIIQGLFGAYTVLTEISPMIALIHTGIATALVGLLAIIVTISVKDDFTVAKGTALKRFNGFWHMTLWLLGLTYILILSGAYVTRTGASLACQKIPMCGVSIAEMTGIQWNHMIHRIIAALVFILMIYVLRKSKSIGYKRISNLITAMLSILSIQIILGIGNVLLGLPSELRALHLTTATVFFAACSLLVGVLWYIKGYNLDIGKG
jgi:heme A synthase